MLQEGLFDQDVMTDRGTRSGNKPAAAPKVWTMHR